MCGIFGNITNNPVKIDVSSVNILGIYNIERGKQSCGLTWDGEIHHGVDKDKLYIDFIKNRSIKPKKFPVLFGHTRQSSTGTGLTIDNAHPFGYGEINNGDSYEFIFVHNGTLKNHKELAKKYNIDIAVSVVKEYANGGTYTTTRDKIDSEILGEILWKTKSYHVLSEYVGAAACAWMWCNEPNKIYLYSGASKKHVDDEVKTLFEERPLNVFQRSKNSTFFSSLPESLTSIGATKENVSQIDYNTIHIVQDGDFKNCEKVKITRVNAGQDDTYRSYNNYSRHDYGHKSQDYYNGFNNAFDNHNCNVKNRTLNSTTSTSINLSSEVPINNINSYKGKVYFQNLRYKKNGHTINGIYCYIKDFGFKFLSEDYTKACEYADNIKDAVFENGEWKFDLVEGYVPFVKKSNIQFHYFTDGVALRTINDYIKCVEFKKNPINNSRYLGYVAMSNISKHPLISETIKTACIAYYDGQPFTGSICELGFERIYTFKDGKCTKFEKRKDLVTENPVIQLSINFKKDTDDSVLIEAQNKIKEEEEQYQKDLIKLKLEEDDIQYVETIEDTESLDEWIAEWIGEDFQSHVDNLEKSVETLKDFIEHPVALEANNTLKMVINVINEFIQIPNNK